MEVWQRFIPEDTLYSIPLPFHLLSQHLCAVGVVFTAETTLP
jgi:hypothetical protein